MQFLFQGWYGIKYFKGKTEYKLKYKLKIVFHINPP